MSGIPLFWTLWLCLKRCQTVINSDTKQLTSNRDSKCKYTEYCFKLHKLFLK